MKTLKMNNLAKNTLTAVLVIVMFSVFESCSTESAFLTSSVVPAAEGSIKVKKDKNDNYSINLKITRLADPSRLTPPKAVYILWVESEQNAVKNIGQLKTSSGLLSRELSSSLSTISPVKPTGFFITAEDDATIQYPGPIVVLKTRSDLKSISYNQ